MTEGGQTMSGADAFQARSPLVRLRGVGRRFGRAEAVAPLELDIHQSDFLAILGPSAAARRPCCA